MSRKPNGCFEHELVKKQCEKAAGPYFDDLLRSYQVTKTYLTHPDAQARLGALMMIREYWKPGPDFALQCEQIANADEDLRVRCLALNCLISGYYGSKDIRVGEWLARIIKDNEQSGELRKHAYFVLFAVRAVRPSPSVLTFRFPQDVDWRFVDSFVNGGVL